MTHGTEKMQEMERPPSPDTQPAIQQGQAKMDEELGEGVMGELQLQNEQTSSVASAAARLYEEILATCGIRMKFWDGGGEAVRWDRPGAQEAVDAAEVPAPLVRQAIDSGQACQSGAEEQKASWFAIPLKQRGKVVTVAGGCLTAERAGTENLLVILEAALTAKFNQLIALSDIEQMSESLANSYEEISLLYRLSNSILANQPPEEFFQRSCYELLEVMNVEGVAAVLLPGKAQNEPPKVISAGTLPLDAAKIPELCLSFTPLDGQPLQPIIQNHCQKDIAVTRLSTAIRNFVMVPLQQGTRGYGIIAAFNKFADEDEPRAADSDPLLSKAGFDSTDVKLVTSVAGTSSIFIDNFNLYNDLKELMIGLIKALVSAIDAKDPYTCGHSERVAITARRVAETMGLTHDVTENVYMAGLLHDIGKIGIPEHILLKEGKLEPDERKVMQQHPVIGGRILSGIKQLEDVIPGVEYHHERVDGGGYPEGLDQDSLPLISRIIGLADAFDAMTSSRPYRPTMHWETVLAEIRRNTGLQFDVRVVDAFFSLDLKELMREFMSRPTTYVGNLTQV